MTQIFEVATANGIFHSTHHSYRDAVDQADMIHGQVLLATGLSDRDAWKWAVRHQGCGLSWEEWTGQDNEEREGWELGAQGIGTV